MTGARTLSGVASSSPWGCPVDQVARGRQSKGEKAALAARDRQGQGLCVHVGRHDRSSHHIEKSLPFTL